MKDIRNSFIFILGGVLLMVASLQMVPLRATELVIEGNGNDSVNEVSVDTSTQTTVTQENTVNIANDVQTQSNTGNNSASDNSGDVAIATGDSTTIINVATDVNNTQTTVTDCCESSTATISGNGTGSTNTVNAAAGGTTTVNTINTATVTNTLKGTAVTGNNTANGNGGTVAIATGDILANVGISNKANTTSLSVGGGSGGFVASILANGAYSKNGITYDGSQNTMIHTLNTALFNNYVWFDLLTGGNIANKNNGNVNITTGDIIATIGITNEANTSSVDIDGCCEETPDDPGDPGTGGPSDPGNPGSSGNGSSSSGSSSSSSSGSGGTGGQVLGLSDTSSGPQGIAFFAGLFTLAFGIKRLTYALQDSTV